MVKGTRGSFCALAIGWQLSSLWSSDSTRTLWPGRTRLPRPILPQIMGVLFPMLCAAEEEGAVSVKELAFPAFEKLLSVTLNFGH